LNGTQMPATASAASTKNPALVTATKKPDIGNPEDTVVTPSGPESPSAQGQVHRKTPPNSAVPSRRAAPGTRPESARPAPTPLQTATWTYLELNDKPLRF
jgi:hypothetical protein